MASQAELIKGMKDREILFHLYLTQLILLSISLILGLVFFDSVQSFISLWSWDIRDILFVGGGAALVVIIIDGVLMLTLPKEMYDDGGINDKVFQNRSIAHIFFISLIVSVSEEVLFRGVIQTHFGYIFASIVFAMLHIRYLTKWVLFIVVMLLSFFIGWVFEVTTNLFIVIFAHFLIDFVFALIIRINYVKNKR